MIPITIITGFLGSGKTTILLSLLPQLPSSYKLAVLKNEFGDVAVDSQLAAAGSVSGVQELLNGCICCNLVGQLGDALDELATAYSPDRIVIETSGSAHPATLALEVNRLAQERTNQDDEASKPRYVLDGVAVVIDVENWTGYADTSYTAKLQAQYTDLVILNKWEDVTERRMDEVLDRLGDLDVPVARIRSDRGKIDAGVLLGLDGGLARASGVLGKVSLDLPAQHDHDHSSEVEVLSVSLLDSSTSQSVDLEALETLLLSAPKDEVYRIKAVLSASGTPTGSDGTAAAASHVADEVRPYALNWAFGRWTFSPLQEDALATLMPAAERAHPVLRMTLVTARGEADGWRRRVERQGHIKTEGGGGKLMVERLL